MAVQMTRAEYEAKYGQPVPSKPAPVQMTRAEYEAKYAPTQKTTALGTIQDTAKKVASATGFGGTVDYLGTNIAQLTNAASAFGKDTTVEQALERSKTLGQTNLKQSIGAGALLSSLVAGGISARAASSIPRLAANTIIGAAALGGQAAAENRPAGDVARQTAVGGALGAAVETALTAAPYALTASQFAWSKVPKLATFLKGLTGKAPFLGAVKEGTSIEDVARLADAQKNIQNISEAVMKGEAAPHSLKTAAESLAVPTTFIEKMAGLAPDVKARIKGKGKLLADYLNIMDARNASDLVPSPLEYGASFADNAVSEMNKLLSESGGKIGSFRQKIATYQAPRESFNVIRSSFEGELAKLNLVVKNGVIYKVPGKIAQTVSDAEIKALQGLYDDLNIASRSPSLENLIDLRNKFDNKINFEKAAREASNTLDPLSRSVRKKIADTAAQIVGKSEAKNLEDYTKFMDALNDLSSYTDRKAGGEFLLKRVFSERGGDPRAVMQTIKEYTGIDLMDHAMMAKIATELSGNASVQGLFRQEITKAGLDAVNLLKGNPTGALGTFVQKSIDTAIDQRKVFERAAQ